MTVPRPPAPLPVTLLVVPRFPLHALALAVDTLRVANRAALGALFSWQIVAETRAPVLSSAGIAITPERVIAEVDFAPVAVVLAAYEPEQAGTPALLAWLRRQDRLGALLGCVDTGALLLARAGLLRDAGASVHQAALEGARENFPGQRFSARLFLAEKRRLSTAGGVATVDMMLALVEQRAGRRLADRVAAMLNHLRRAPPELAGAGREHASAHSPLARCVELMGSHLEDPLSLPDLAAACGEPEWRLRRLFRRHLGSTPMSYYRDLRLSHARQLLAYSQLSVAAVAAATGFADSASLGHAFRRCYGQPPSAARRDVDGMREADA